MNDYYNLVSDKARLLMGNSTQGRQVGVGEEVMLQAVTHVPEPEPEQTPE